MYNKFEINNSALFKRRRNRLTKERMCQILKYILYFILGFIFGFLIWINISPYYIDENYGKIDLNGTNFDEIEIETLCSKNTSKQCCYSVVDTVDRKTSRVHRVMYKNGYKNYNTVVQLIPPKGLTFETSDTRLWAINNTVITTQHTAATITQLFATMLSSNEDENEILILCFENLDMFLHRKMPNIKITIVEEESVIVELAKRWFGLVEDERRKIIIKDAITAITEAKNNGNKYDTVILHCCENTTAAVACTSTIILTDEILTKIKSILKPNGSLIVNVLNFKDQTNHFEKIIKTLITNFDICIKMTVKNEENVVVSCLQYPFPGVNLNDVKELILQEAKKAVNEFGISAVLENFDLTIVQTFKRYPHMVKIVSKDQGKNADFF